MSDLPPPSSKISESRILRQSFRLFYALCEWETFAFSVSSLHPRSSSRNSSKQPAWNGITSKEKNRMTLMNSWAINCASCAFSTSIFRGVRAKLLICHSKTKWSKLSYFSWEKRTKNDELPRRARLKSISAEKHIKCNLWRGVFHFFFSFLEVHGVHFFALLPNCRKRFNLPQFGMSAQKRCLIVSQPCEWVLSFEEKFRIHVFVGRKGNLLRGRFQIWTHRNAFFNWLLQNGDIRDLGILFIAQSFRLQRSMLLTRFQNVTLSCCV